MGDNPYVLAFLASLCFGVVFFPWRAAAQTVGPVGVFLLVGLAYLCAGAAFWYLQGIPATWTLRGVGAAAVLGVLYVAALLCLNGAVAHPRVNFAVASAITAAYPIFTAAISMAWYHQRLSKQEALFFAMTVIGVIGLGLSSRTS